MRRFDAQRARAGAQFRKNAPVRPPPTRTVTGAGCGRLAPVRPLRRVLSVLLVLVAVVLLPAALATSWVDRTVADREGYLEAVTPLADDEAVQDAVTVRVRVAVLRLVGAPSVAEEALGDAVSLAVRRVVASQAFPPLWRASNEVAHTSLVEVLSQPVGEGGDVRIDVTPVVEAVLDQLPAPFLADRIEVPPTSFTVAGTGEIDEARRVWQAVEGRGTVVPLLAVATLVLALVVSPLRRRTGMLAAGLALPALGLLAVSLVAGRRVVEAGAPRGEERELVLQVWDALVADLWVSTAVAAGVALVLLLVLAALPRRRATA